MKALSSNTEPVKTFKTEKTTTETLAGKEDATRKFEESKKETARFRGAGRVGAGRAAGRGAQETRALNRMNDRLMDELEGLGSDTTEEAEGEDGVYERTERED